MQDKRDGIREKRGRGWKEEKKPMNGKRTEKEGERERERKGERERNSREEKNMVVEAFVFPSFNGSSSFSMYEYLMRKY